MKSKLTIVLAATAALAWLESATAQSLTIPDGRAYTGKKMAAKVYNSNFALGHDSYNAMGTGSDGKIYYVLSSESVEVGAKMFRFDPKSQKITQLADLTEACGEQDAKAIPQGKSHVNFVAERDFLSLRSRDEEPEKFRQAMRGR